MAPAVSLVVAMDSRRCAVNLPCISLTRSGINIDPEAEIRRRLGLLHGALQALQGHPFARDIGRAIAGLERDLVALVGSVRAYEIVEEVRVAAGFGEVPHTAPPTTSRDQERLRALSAAIAGKEEDLNMAIASPKGLGELRHINDDLAALAKEKSDLLATDRADAIIRGLRAKGLVP